MNYSLFKLDNVIQHYIWGSKTALGTLFAIPNPNNVPQAEIWMGSHPNGCSKVAGHQESIADLIKQDAQAVLGRDTADRYGDLPYLFKVLSAQNPLSIQVHPTKENAQLGYEKENQQGIALDAPNRNYKDANHKPELVYALTPYRAMNGFRPIHDILKLFHRVAIKALEKDVSALESQPNQQGLKTFFSIIMGLTGEKKQAVIAQLMQAVAMPHHLVDDEATRIAFATIAEFSQQYPDDIGLLAPLMLNLVLLQPGEAMFLHAETPHAYIQGTALEIMANSDNVLRAGLTPKYIDVDELLDNTKFVPIPPEKIKLAPYESHHKRSYPIPVDDFKFEIITVSNQIGIEYLKSAEIIFCLQGQVTLKAMNSEVMLKPGESAFVIHNVGRYQYQGNGVVARAFN
jgi:mannose-6-phosphate isomerase